MDYLDDLESDFSVLHRVDDMYAVPGPRFLRLAARTVAYQGVMQARAQGLMDAEATESAPTSQAPMSGGGTRVLGNGDRMVEVAPTRDALRADPVMSGLIEMG